MIRRPLRSPFLVLLGFLAAAGMPAPGTGRPPDPPALAPAPGPDTSLGRTIEVPFDHRTPSLGSGSLYCEFGAPFDRGKPTVIVVADGQQFYVRRGAVAEIQEETFGDAFNVLGLVGRGTSEAFLDAVKARDGSTDWKMAWRIFNAEQWVEDIEAVRRAVVGDDGRILLFGASGGAFLVHQVLSKHGDRVLRAFTASPVNPYLVGELRLSTDRFWEEIGEADPALQGLLGTALARYAGERDRLVMTLQRQNFFVPPESLEIARAKLIRALAAGDDSAYAQAREEFQVDLVRQLLASSGMVPIRVREYELFEPAGGSSRLGGPALRPDLEVQRTAALPLLEALGAGGIPPPDFGRPIAQCLDTEVFLLAGRRDHTVDYRSVIALASVYPHHALFLADDDHVFARMKKSGSYTKLVRAFLLEGLEGAGFRAALQEAEPERWVEP